MLDIFIQSNKYENRYRYKNLYVVFIFAQFTPFMQDEDFEEFADRWRVQPQRSHEFEYVSAPAPVPQASASTARTQDQHEKSTVGTQDQSDKSC